MTTGWGAAPERPRSLKCAIYGDRPHKPCAGTTDDGTGRECECECHCRAMPEAAEAAPRRGMAECGTQWLMLAFATIAASAVIGDAFHGGPAWWWMYPAALGAIVTLALNGYAVDRSWHSRRHELDEYRDKLVEFHGHVLSIAVDLAGGMIEIPDMPDGRNL